MGSGQPCTFCAKFADGKKPRAHGRAFAKFGVRELPMFQDRHCRSAFHKAAQKALFAVDTSGLEPDAEALDGMNTCAPSVGQMVPRADRIMLALQIGRRRLAPCL